MATIEVKENVAFRKSHA